MPFKRRFYYLSCSVILLHREIHIRISDKTIMKRNLYHLFLLLSILPMVAFAGGNGKVGTPAVGVDYHRETKCS